jgi:hypothetical protein
MADDIDVLNLSADGAAPLYAKRHSLRHPGNGRWIPRSSTEVRSLSQPAGRGGYDSVTREWRPDVPNNAVLHRSGDLMADELVHSVRPDWSNNPPISMLMRVGTHYHPYRRA